MEKIKPAGTAIHFPTLFIILFTIFLINGCKKKSTQEDMTLKGNNISLTQIAKNYFTNLANKEKESPLLQSSAIKQTKSTNSRITPILKISPCVLWDNATEQDRNGFDYVIIPLKGNIKPFKNKSFEFFRNIIFYQDKTKKANMVILEVLSKKDQSLGNDLQKIAITSFENKHFSHSQSIEALNASVIFYNENYLRDTSFQLQNGKWAPARISFRSDLDINQ